MDKNISFNSGKLGLVTLSALILGCIIKHLAKYSSGSMFRELSDSLFSLFSSMTADESG